MDAHERALLSQNPFIKLLLHERKKGATTRQAAEAVLKRELDLSVTDDELLDAERELNAVLATLPPEATKVLFAKTLEVKELTDVFSLTVHHIARSRRDTDEAKALGLTHLWSWFWERDVVSWRRFLRTGRTNHDVLAQVPSLWRPGIPGKPFWKLDELPEAFRSLEANAPAITEELERVRKSGQWLPYGGVRGERDQPTVDTASTWNGYFFYHPFKGRFAEAHDVCPVTSRVLEALPGLCRRELVLFSALTPGAVVPPHQGPFNGRLRVHLALTGAKGCFLRVGTQIRQWEDGRVLVFDDSFEHQVCHAGDEVRVVLMFNVLQPGLEPDVLDRAAQATPDGYVPTEEDLAARELLARTAWW